MKPFIDKQAEKIEKIRKLARMDNKDFDPFYGRAGKVISRAETPICSNPFMEFDYGK